MKDHKTIISELHQSHPTVAKTTINDIVNEFIEIKVSELKKDGITRIKGMGSFKVVKSGRRVARHIITKEAMVLQPSKRVKYVPSAILKKEVKEL